MKTMRKPRVIWKAKTFSQGVPESERGWGGIDGLSDMGYSGQGYLQGLENTGFQVTRDTAESEKAGV